MDADGPAGIFLVQSLRDAFAALAPVVAHAEVGGRGAMAWLTVPTGPHLGAPRRIWR